MLLGARRSIPMNARIECQATGGRTTAQRQGPGAVLYGLLCCQASSRGQSLSHTAWQAAQGALLLAASGCMQSSQPGLHCSRESAWCGRNAFSEPSSTPTPPPPPSTPPKPCTSERLMHLLSHCPHLALLLLQALSSVQQILIIKATKPARMEWYLRQGQPLVHDPA